MTDPTPRLVFGDDGSAAADAVWLWITNHRWPGWRISVLTAQPTLEYGPEAVERAQPRPWEGNGSRRLPADSEAELELLFAEADPRVALLSFRDAHLLAVGPRGTGLLKRLNLGSTTEWLLTQPVAPVAVIRSGRPTRHVMLCVDGSDPAHRAVEWFARLPWAGSTRVTVLAVAEGGGPAPATTTADLESASERVVEVLQPTGADITTELRGALRGTHASDVRSVILDAVDELVPDLVVVGTRGLGRLQRMVLGSTATAVVRHAPCSVVVVP